MGTTTPDLRAQRRGKNLRTGLIFGSVALALFLGFLLRQFLGR